MGKKIKLESISRTINRSYPSTSKGKGVEKRTTTESAREINHQQAEAPRGGEKRGNTPGAGKEEGQ